MCVCVCVWFSSFVLFLAHLLSSFYPFYPTPHQKQYNLQWLHFGKGFVASLKKSYWKMSIFPKNSKISQKISKKNRKYCSFKIIFLKIQDATFFTYKIKEKIILQKTNYIFQKNIFRSFLKFSIFNIFHIFYTKMISAPVLQCLYGFYLPYKFAR